MMALCWQEATEERERLQSAMTTMREQKPAPSPAPGCERRCEMLAAPG